MKISIILFSILTLMILSCGDSNSTDVESLKDEIKLKEDSLSVFQSDKKQIPEKNQESLISSLVKFYTLHPNDKYAPECLDKIHMLYSAIGNYRRSSEYADLLLEKYPKYINREMILESQASNFDIFIIPRDSVKVKYYYSLMLKENPKMDKNKKEEIQMRLEHVSLTFDEYIEVLTKGHDIR